MPIPILRPTHVSPEEASPLYFGLQNLQKGIGSMAALQKQLQQQKLQQQMMPLQKQLLEAKIQGQTTLKPTSLMQNVMASGFNQGTPEFQKEMRSVVEKPLVTVGVGLSPQEAGRAQMFKSALEDFDVVEKAFFDEKGNPNRINIAEANIPFIGGSIPSTEGGKARNVMDNAISAMLRAETGAVATQREVEDTRQRYTPSIWDSSALARQKIHALKRRLQGTVGLLGPKAGVSPSVSHETIGTQNVPFLTVKGNKVMGPHGKWYTTEEIG